MKHKHATLQYEDVRSDISAALSMALAVEIGVLPGHEGCPFAETALKAKCGLVRLLARFDADHE